LARKLGRPPTRIDKEGYRPIYKMYREVKDLINNGQAQTHSNVISEGVRTTTSPDPPESESLDSPPNVESKAKTSGKSSGATATVSFAPNPTATGERKLGTSASSSRGASTTNSSSSSTSTTPTGNTTTTASATAVGGRQRGVIASGGRKGLEQARRSTDGLPASTGVASMASSSSSSIATSSSSGSTSAKQLKSNNNNGSVGTSTSTIAQQQQHGEGSLHAGAGMVGSGLLVPTAMPIITSAVPATTSSSSSSTSAASAQAAAAARAGVIGSGSSSSSVQSLAMNAPPSPLKAAVVERMKAEKRQLQIKLNRFEQTFRQLKGRPIKYAKDIAPVRAGIMLSTCSLCHCVLNLLSLSMWCRMVAIQNLEG
jgi:hypothetical protein